MLEKERREKKDLSRNLPQKGKGSGWSLKKKSRGRDWDGWVSHEETHMRGEASGKGRWGGENSVRIFDKGVVGGQQGLSGGGEKTTSASRTMARFPEAIRKKRKYWEGREREFHFSKRESIEVGLKECLPKKLLFLRPGKVLSGGREKTRACYATGRQVLKRELCRSRGGTELECRKKGENIIGREKCICL